MLLAYNRYIVGNPVTLTGTFQNPVSKALVDPTDARVDVVDPTGTSTTYAWTNGTGPVLHVSTGVFTYLLDTASLFGRYQYRWWSPGPTAKGAGFNEFFIDPFATPTP